MNYETALGIAGRIWCDHDFSDYAVDPELAEKLAYLILSEALKQEHEKRRASLRLPRIVCLCGLDKFVEAFVEANVQETLAGKIVLTIGVNQRRGDLDHLSGEEQARVKKELDVLHKRKIDLADEILVLNVGGHIDDSTRSEITYAISQGKEVRWLERWHAQG